MTPIDINDPLDLVGLLIVGAVLVMVACLPAWITTRKNRELHSDVAEIKDQTVNDHGERPEQNLRVQMDRIEARQKDAAAQQDRIEARQDDTSADIRGLRKDFGELRGEVRDARRDHREFEARVHTAYRREHPGADPL